MQVLHDVTTTYTNHPIVIDVLFNDFFQGNGEGAGGLHFDSSSLMLAGIESDGMHGRCTINRDGIKVLYTPDEGYSGTDKCGYKVCHELDGENCQYATISITIAKVGIGVAQESIQEAMVSPEDEGEEGSRDGEQPDNWSASPGWETYNGES